MGCLWSSILMYLKASCSENSGKFQDFFYMDRPHLHLILRKPRSFFLNKISENTYLVKPDATATMYNTHGGASPVPSRAPKFTQHQVLLHYNVLRNATQRNATANRPQHATYRPSNLFGNSQHFVRDWIVWTQFHLRSENNQKLWAHHSIKGDPR